MFDPAAGVALAGAAGATPSLARLLYRWVKDRASRGDRALAAGAAKVEMSVEDLEAAAGEDELKLKLTGDALTAAMSSTLETKIIALGHALAWGVTAKDEQTIAWEQRIVHALSRIELLEVRVLEVVSGDYRTQPSFAALEMGWSHQKVAAALPQLEGLIAPGLAVLVSEGLIADQNPGQMNVFSGAGQFTVTGLGETVLERLRLAARQPPFSAEPTRNTLAGEEENPPR